MWNDTELPLGYLITFRSYGTWLHDDERGSIDRFHNRYHSPYLPRCDRRRFLNEGKLKSPSLTLDIEQRGSVDSAIREVCEHHRWVLHAINVRTNHVHVVVSIGQVNAGHALNALKAYATRRMRHEAIGKRSTARGLIRVATDIFGTSVAWRLQSTTSSMAGRRTSGA